MPRPAEPGRRLLLDAGRRILGDAHGSGLAEVSVNDVVAAAGRSKGAFYQHFPDRTAYLAALHVAFHDALAQTVADAIASVPPGRDRLLAGATAFLDECLVQGTTKSLLVQARHDPHLSELAAARDRQFADLAATDFTALGAAEPVASARLFVAVVKAVAQEEATEGRLDDLRAALAETLRG